MVFLKEVWQKTCGFRKYAFTTVNYMCLENIFIVPVESVEWKDEKVGKA